MCMCVCVVCVWFVCVRVRCLNQTGQDKSVFFYRLYGGFVSCGSVVFVHWIVPGLRRKVRTFGTACA